MHPDPERPDLFGALVRLEVAGWTTGPAAPEHAEDAPASLARLLRKCSWLEGPDGTRFDLTGLDAPDMAGVFVGHGANLWRLSGPLSSATGTWLTLHGEALRVWELDAGGREVRLTALAGSLEEWLVQLGAGTAASGVVDPQPLPDLAEVGDGVGWRLDELMTPVRLGSVPEEVAGKAFELDGELLWVGQRVMPLDDFVTDTVPADAVEDEPDLDDLFGRGGGRPRPRTGQIMALLLAGIVLSVLGMACISAPGGILVLLAWMVVETDQKRLESGYLPASDAHTVERSRRFTYAGLVLVVFLFAVQAFLLCNGAYDVLLDLLYIPLWQTFVRGLLEGEAILPLL